MQELSPILRELCWPVGHPVWQVHWRVVLLWEEVDDDDDDDGDDDGDDVDNDLLQEHLPYADDSTAVTPKSELNGGIIVDTPTKMGLSRSKNGTF